MNSWPDLDSSAASNPNPSLFKLKLGNREGTPLLPMAQPPATSQINTT